MGNDLQTDHVAQVGVVGQVLRQPSVVEARELLEHQAGQELGLGELLGAELVTCAGSAGRLPRRQPGTRDAGIC